ncbi:MAG: hypothetical protein EZS28_040207, partial [Streblomastix strix]
SRSREKRQMQPQLLQINPQITPKAIRPVQDSRNRNKDLTQTTKQKQNPIPRLTSRISWTEEEREEERREGRDLENRETDKENREILISGFASPLTVACNCVPLSFFLSPSFLLVTCLGSIACSDQSLSSLSSVPSATILFNSLDNCSLSSFSDSIICSAASVIRPITASGIDWYIWGCMLMNPATPSLTFSNPGTYDPLGKFAHSSRLSVSQRQQGTTPQRTSPSNCSYCSSDRFRSLGLGIGIGRQFLGGQKNIGPSLFGQSLRIAVVWVALVQVPFPCILVDFREGLLLVQLMCLPMMVMLSVVIGVVKRVCEMYCVMDLCNLSLCFDYPNPIV